MWTRLGREGTFKTKPREADHGELVGVPIRSAEQRLALKSRMSAQSGTVAFAVTAFEQRDWRDENSPPSFRSGPAVRLRRLPVPARHLREGRGFSMPESPQRNSARRYPPRRHPPSGQRWTARPGQEGPAPWGRPTGQARGPTCCCQTKRRYRSSPCSPMSTTATMSTTRSGPLGRCSATGWPRRQMSPILARGPRQPLGSPGEQGPPMGRPRAPATPQPGLVPRFGPTQAALAAQHASACRRRLRGVVHALGLARSAPRRLRRCPDRSGSPGVVGRPALRAHGKRRHQHVCPAA